MAVWWGVGCTRSTAASTTEDGHSTPGGRLQGSQRGPLRPPGTARDEVHCSGAGSDRRGGLRRLGEDPRRGGLDWRWRGGGRRAGGLLPRAGGGLLPRVGGGGFCRGSMVRSADRGGGGWGSGSGLGAAGPSGACQTPAASAGGPSRGRQGAPGTARQGVAAGQGCGDRGEGQGRWVGRRVVLSAGAASCRQGTAAEAGDGPACSAGRASRLGAGPRHRKTDRTVGGSQWRGCPVLADSTGRAGPGQTKNPGQWPPHQWTPPGRGAGGARR